MALKKYLVHKSEITECVSGPDKLLSKHALLNIWRRARSRAERSVVTEEREREKTVSIRSCGCARGALQQRQRLERVVKRPEQLELSWDPHRAPMDCTIKVGVGAPPGDSNPQPPGSRGV
ncbi:hypothetical protein CRUP_019632 [Coryphaenoides rupestris]|nr:hypothetical protein CRUP_019632 [Coryphaenoides rupestris]